MNLFLYLNYYYSFSDLPDDPKADWDTQIGGQIITEYIKHNHPHGAKTASCEKGQPGERYSVTKNNQAAAGTLYDTYTPL